ncbi:MAG TPA: cysteine--tRNA ligase [Candidatus Aenigmarchaeota archaeon]|nr:cysteine--tRNA ligase [Candidatus Aenigmarchaeota archaeon]
MVLKVFNTLTGKKEVFKPLKKGEVRMYVCGPTVYDYSHIGHARTYTAFDIIHRWLEFKGFKVTWVMNITDVDDKMIKRARKERTTVFELATRMSQAFFKDMDALGIHPDIYCFATGHIPEMIQLIKKLEENGHAYVIDDGVYYDVSKFKDYGKLSKQKREELIKHRVEPNPKKRNPGDFALWKFKKRGEPSWTSPWGEGRPGWHIECSAMSTKYLGEQFDIHGGGQDLIFPHHENEIAQSEAAFGKKPWVRYWLHTGFLNIHGEKMSKSLGNIIPIKEMLKNWDAEVLRLFFVSKHYRSPIDFRESLIEEIKNGLDRIYNVVEKVKSLKTVGKLTTEERKVLKDLNKAKDGFIKAMDDDFNTPKAMATVFNFVRKLNKFLVEKKSINKKLKAEIESFFHMFSEVFGVLKGRKVKPREESLKKLIDMMVEVREELRKRKNFELSDKIRSKLKEIGVQVEDTPKGVKWKFV